MSLVTPTARGYAPVFRNFLVPLNTVTPTRSVPTPTVITPTAFTVGLATNITSTGFTLSWTESGNADQYKVDYGSGHTYYIQNSPITINDLPVNLIGQTVTVTAISSTGTTRVGTGTPFVTLLGYAGTAVISSATAYPDGSQCLINWGVPSLPFVGDAFGIRMTRPANAYYPAKPDYFFFPFDVSITTYNAGLDEEFLGYTSAVTVETYQANAGLQCDYAIQVGTTAVYNLTSEDFGSVTVGSTIIVAGFDNPTFNGTFVVVDLNSSAGYSVRCDVTTQSGYAGGDEFKYMCNTQGPLTVVTSSTPKYVTFPLPLPTIPTATIQDITDTTVNGTFDRNEVPGDAPSYTIVFSPSEGVAGYIDVSKGTFNAIGLTPETEYTFTITAFLTSTRYSEYTSEPFTTLTGIPTLVLNATPVSNTKNLVILKATPYPIDARFTYVGYLGNSYLSTYVENNPGTSTIYFGWGPGNIPPSGTPVYAIIRVTDPLTKQYKDSNAIPLTIGS